MSSVDGLAGTILAPACGLRSGDLCEAVTSPYEVVEHTHDVVGTGGAGLRAALGMASSGLIDCSATAVARQ
ncbi:MAG TPA: hypothetical protein VNO18_01790 [Xanthobacteraceae bacterium]|jgi:hypothetical protein|nr:hypothetical protein [Xanthobacteraceae bacterium]